MAHKRHGVYISSWRVAANEAIEKALQEAAEQKLDEEATWRHVSKAYPFGERRYHPYKIWLSAVKEAKLNRLKARGAIHTAQQAKLFWVTPKIGLNGSQEPQLIFKVGGDDK